MGKNWTSHAAHLIVCAMAGWAFGEWQNSVAAGIFVFLAFDQLPYQSKKKDSDQ